MPKKIFLFMMVIGMVFTATTWAAGATHMDLTWDFYNQFDRAIAGSPGESFMRYHLVTFGYTTKDQQDLTLLYDWFDWTEGATNTHALTPWAAIYTKELRSDLGKSRVQAGYWLVSDIAGHTTAAKEARVIYTVSRDIAPRTNLELSVGAKAPASSDVSPIAGVNLRKELCKAQLIAGVNNISVLDDILLSAGRTPVSVGVRYEMRDGATVHLDVIYLAGTEPDHMISRWVRTKTNLVGRFGFDFAML
jgi:hypothetical protein